MCDRCVLPPGACHWLRVSLRFARGFGVAALLCWGDASHAQDTDQAPLSVSAAEGGYRYFVVTQDETPLRDAPAVSAREVAVIFNGQRFHNLGCAHSAGVLWCEGRVIDGKERGFLQGSVLRPAAAQDGTFPKGVNDSRDRVRRDDFDREGRIKCAQVDGQTLGDCRVQVAFAGGGDATARVTFPNSFTRELYFVDGGFQRANTTMSGVGTDTEWRVENGDFVIRVDDQRFRIPADFIFGE